MAGLCVLGHVDQKVQKPDLEPVQILNQVMVERIALEMSSKLRVVTPTYHAVKLLTYYDLEHKNEFNQ